MIFCLSNTIPNPEQKHLVVKNGARFIRYDFIRTHIPFSDGGPSILRDRETEDDELSTSGNSQEKRDTIKVAENYRIWCVQGGSTTVISVLQSDRVAGGPNHGE
ncbi:hypothetical protein J2741_000181 [Methanolinea mesophila]|nr:hypothetical protein [Methanolinea mesophila]